tara:strand:+ start:27903 stop:28712 length:810 start_codon:yes stop_codon:yes gene_type:complete
VSSTAQEGAEVNQIAPLDQGVEPGAWKLKVTDEVAGATGTLHGGCGLAAAAGALERTTGRRLAYISGQFLARASVGAEVDIEVRELAVGNRITQAAVTCRHGELTVFRAAAALGGHDLEVDRQWSTPPEVPEPEQCSSRGATSESGRSFNDFADIRLAWQKPGEKDVYYWARLDDTLASSTQGLIALADLLPSGMRVSLDKGFRGSSLDHSVRLLSQEQSSWVLLCIRSAAIENSIGHGSVEIFSRTGTLLAVATQSFAISSITGSLDR